MKLIILTVLAWGCHTIKLKLGESQRMDNNVSRLLEGQSTTNKQGEQQVTEGTEQVGPNQSQPQRQGTDQLKKQYPIQLAVPDSFEIFSKEGLEVFNPANNLEYNSGVGAIPNLQQIKDANRENLVDIKQDNHPLSQKIHEQKVQTPTQIDKIQQQNLLKLNTTKNVQILNKQTQTQIVKNNSNQSMKKDENINQQLISQPQALPKSQISSQIQQNVSDHAQGQLKSKNQSITQTFTNKAQITEIPNEQKSQPKTESSVKQQQDLLTLYKPNQLEKQNANPVFAKKEENNSIQQPLKNKANIEPQSINKTESQGKQAKQQKKRNQGAQEIQKQNNSNQKIGNNEKQQRHKKDAQDDKSSGKQSLQNPLNEYLEKLRKMDYPFTIPSIIATSLFGLFVVAILITGICCCCKKCSKDNQVERSSPVSSEIQGGENIFHEVPPSSDRDHKTGGSLGKYKYGIYNY